MVWRQRLTRARKPTATTSGHVGAWVIAATILGLQSIPRYSGACPCQKSYFGARPRVDVVRGQQSAQDCLPETRATAVGSWGRTAATRTAPSLRRPRQRSPAGWTASWRPRRGRSSSCWSPRSRIWVATHNWCSYCATPSRPTSTRFSRRFATASPSSTSSRPLPRLSMPGGWRSARCPRMRWCAPIGSATARHWTWCSRRFGHPNWTRS